VYIPAAVCRSEDLVQTTFEYVAPQKRQHPQSPVHHSLPMEPTWGKLQTSSRCPETVFEPLRDRIRKAPSPVSPSTQHAWMLSKIPQLLPSDAKYPTLSDPETCWVNRLAESCAKP